MRRDSVKKIMKDVSQDAEVRIVAYLMLMKCPDFGVITEVKKLLATEEVNQGNTFCEICEKFVSIFKQIFHPVGSFVWTHLNNLAKSSLPSKLHVQGLVLNQQLAKKFDTDTRKFSRNWETSVFFDQFNAGKV